MILTANPEPYAETDFMLHSPIFNRGTQSIQSWPIPYKNLRLHFKVQSGQRFEHIFFDTILELAGSWFNSNTVHSVHLKAFFPLDDDDHAIDISVIDTHLRRMKFYSENGAYLPDTLLYYQECHKSNVLDLYLHHSGRFWVELRP